MTLKQRADLLNQVQRMVRDEIRTARQLEVLKKEEQEEKELSNPSERQGLDYHRRRHDDQEEEHRCPKNPDGSCPPVPDLSQYIRKDQIPCWGCSVDY